MSGEDFAFGFVPAYPLGLGRSCAVDSSLSDVLPVRASPSPKLGGDRGSRTHTVLPTGF